VTAAFPWLTTLGLLPLVGAAVVAGLPRGADRLAKLTALAFALAALALTVVLALRFDPAGPAVQFVEQRRWIPAFGVSYALGLDGIALVLVALTAVLAPVVILAAWDEAVGSRRPAKTFFALLLVTEAAAIGAFAATDVFLFYVFFEVMLVPMYFLIGSFGGPQRSYAAVKFLLYSLAGGLLMLAAVIALYVLGPGGEQGFLLSELQGKLALDPTVQRWLFLGFFAAFAIKAPLWPVHTWLPDAASEATPGTAVLLFGVLDKVGTFGMIRYLLTLFPEASRYFTPMIVVLSVVSILYGALLAIGQTDMKRLLGYTSISHFGFIVLGIFALTSQGQVGATLYMVNHGLSTGLLFIVAGFLMSRRGSRLIADYGGVQRVAPLLAGTFLVGGLSALALPGLSTFVSEFLVLVGTFTRYWVAAVLATLGIVLAAVYVLWMYQRMMTGPVRAGNETMPDLRPREVWAAAPLLAFLLVLGFFPAPVLDVVNPAVRSTLQYVRVQDPAPTVPTQAEGTAK